MRTCCKNLEIRKTILGKKRGKIKKLLANLQKSCLFHAPTKSKGIVPPMLEGIDHMWSMTLNNWQQLKKPILQIQSKEDKGKDNFLIKKIKAKEQRTKLERMRRWARTSPNREKKKFKKHKALSLIPCFVAIIIWWLNDHRDWPAIYRAATVTIIVLLLSSSQVKRREDDTTNDEKSGVSTTLILFSKIYDLIPLYQHVLLHKPQGTNFTNEITISLLSTQNYLILISTHF